MKSILSIGHAAYDITISVDDYPKENLKYRVDNKVECGGGPASNAAYLTAKWGLKTYFAGVVGDDLYGHKIEEEFKNIGVDTTYLQKNSEHSTTNSFILANRKNGSRTIFSYRPSMMKMKNIDFNIDPKLIIVDGQEPEISKKAFEKFPNAIKVIDAGRDKPEVIELCHMVDYVACSKDFAENVTNIKINYTYTNSIVEAYKKLKEMFNTNIIITLEDKGCVYENNGNIKIMPSIKVKSVDSTGAGDIFHGGLAYALASDFDIEKAVKYANIAGALSVEKVGGRFSIPDLKDVEEKYEQYK